MQDLLAALAQWAVQTDTDTFWLVCALTLVALLLLLWGGFRMLRTARLIEDTPTAKVRSAAQGYVELEGRARWMPGPKIHSPLSRTPCVWWQYQIEQRRGSGRNRRWVTLDSERSDDLFFLDDGTGQCVIDPEGAKVIPDLRRCWRGSTRRPLRVPKADPGLIDRIGVPFGSYRYTEALIRIDAPLHAMGRFNTARAIEEADDARAVRELLAEWKQDRNALLARFDLDGDGEIDMQEWAKARQAARETVAQQRATETPPPDTHVLHKPAGRRPFLLSTLPQATLSRRKRLWAIALLAPIAPMAVVLTVLLTSRL